MNGKESLEEFCPRSSVFSFLIIYPPTKTRCSLDQKKTHRLLSRCLIFVVMLDFFFFFSGL